MRLTAEGPADDQAEPDAVGLAYAVEQGGQEQSGHTRRWQARRVVGRALAHARLQEESLRQRAQRAVDESNALNERQQGKKRLAAAAALPAAAAIRAHHRVADVVPSGVRTIVREAPQRRDGQRPAQTLRTTSVQGEARMDQAAREQAVRRLGWRVDATHHDQETMRLKQGGAAYRRADLVAPGLQRLTGRSGSRTPLSWQGEPRIVGLIFLLSIALRVLGLMQLVARENVQNAGPTRTGSSPGQPGRQTTRPTTARLLHVFRGITWSRMTIKGETDAHLTPLHPVPERIVALIGLPLEAFSRLAPPLSKIDFHSHEP